MVSARVENGRSSVHESRRLDHDEVVMQFDGRQHDAEGWDPQIEGDVAAGRLESPERNALHEQRAGRTKPL